MQFDESIRLKNTIQEFWPTLRMEESAWDRRLNDLRPYRYDDVMRLVADYDKSHGDEKTPRKLWSFLWSEVRLLEPENLEPANELGHTVHDIAAICNSLRKGNQVTDELRRATRLWSQGLNDWGLYRVWLMELCQGYTCYFAQLHRNTPSTLTISQSNMSDVQIEATYGS